MKNHFLYTEGGGFPVRVANPEDVEFLVIDLFCGAGGTSTGFSLAKLGQKQIALVIACVNHDPKAIKSHWLNHPETLHFEEDIRTLDLTPLVELLAKYRIIYPNAKVILWASLECTNFSKAKGGQPREADSRTLADHLDRYIIALNPDYIQIENVVEFMSWGPLDENGKPVSRKSGSDWLRWREHINTLGYRDEWREINSADFGAYTSRNRLFGCFAKPELPIVWPEPTHSKKPISNGLFGSTQKWKPVKDVLDFSDEGQSIFNRKKDLSPKTLERIYAGLIKYVAGGKDAFLSVYNSGKPESRNTSINEPCRTVLTANTHSLIQTNFIAKYYSGRPEGKVKSVDEPAGAITCVDGQSLVQPKFMMNYHHSSDVNSINDPCPTLVTRDKLAVINTDFIMKYHGNGDNVQSIENPASTLTTKDRIAKVWIDKQFSSGTKCQSIEAPSGSITTVPKMNLVTAEPFILQTNYGNIGRSIEEPCPTLVASRRHHYIVNPSHGGHSTSIEAPCPVIIARQDKAPLYLMNVECAPVFIPVYEDDSEPLIKIKEFMALYGISDIKMRMLKVSELLLIQGFPQDYKLFGNQSDQKKFIGNSVHPFVPKCWSETMALRLRKLRKEAA